MHVIHFYGYEFLNVCCGMGLTCMTWKNQFCVGQTIMQFTLKGIQKKKGVVCFDVLRYGILLPEWISI